MSNSIHSEREDEVVAWKNGAGHRSLSVERPPVNYAEDAPYTYDTEEEQWNFQKFIAVVLRRRKIMAGVFGVIFVLSVVSAIITPRVYRSTAQVILNSDPAKTSSIDPNNPVLATLLNGANGRSQDTEIEILQSKPVRQAALQLVPGQMKNAPILALDVKPVGQTDLVTVSTSSTNAPFTQQFTDALCRAYVQQSQEQSSRQYGGTASYVKTQLKSLQVKMDTSSDALRDFKERSGISDLTLETTARVGRLQSLQDALGQAHTDTQAGIAQLNRLTSTANNIPITSIAPSQITIRPIVQQLRQQLTNLETQRYAALNEFIPGSPEVRNLDDQIHQIRGQLAREPKTEISTYNNNINLVRQSVDQSIAQLRSQNAANDARVQTLTSQVAVARKALAEVPRQEFRLGQLQLELQTYQKAFNTLQDRLISLQVSEAAPIANARVLSSADTPVQVRPNLRNSTLGGLFLGLLMAVAAALLVDRLDNRIHSEDDVRSATHLPVLAFIPKIAHFEAESLVAQVSNHVENIHSPLLESYRMLRTSLMFTVLDSPLRCIMLTSSQPNEGKSSVAANLATVLAMNGKTVLLLDADLRRPSAHRLFGLNGDEGFTTVAAGMSSLEDAIQDTAIPGLRVLAVGPTPPNPPEMLDSRASRTIIQKAREMADFVIIDAPPALMMADAQIIATEADGILLVVSWEEALKDAVSRTSDLLSRTGIKLLGVVVNKWDDRQATYQNYYQKHYYALSPEAEEAAKAGKVGAAK